MTVALANWPTNRVQHRQQTPAPVSPLDRFMNAARAAGCPRDQVRNFLDAKYPGLELGLESAGSQ